MATVTLDALNVVELAEILEFLSACIDDLAVSALPSCDPNVYNIDDLRADVTRLINRLHTSPLTP